MDQVTATAAPSRRRRPNFHEAILGVASELFYREGIRAVGIDRIIAETGVAKATLYRHFPSKEHLVAAYLTARSQRVLAAMALIIARERGPVDRINAIFDELYVKAMSAEFRGCAFAMAVAEHGVSEPVLAIARGHKTAVIGVFATILADADAAEDNGAGSSECEGARQLALIYDGALSLVSITGNHDLVLSAKASALAVLKQFLPDHV